MGCLLKFQYLVLACALLGLCAGYSTLTPDFPFDPETTSYCSLWWNTDESNYMSCDEVRGFNFLSIEIFTRWNPSITAGCGNFIASGHSYCVEVKGEPSQPVTTAPISSTGTVSSTPATSTSPSNGITTPVPIQPGMTNNCDVFYLTKAGDNCGVISALYGVSQAQLEAWNPGFGAGCGGIWADVYVCVSIVGHTPVTPTATPTKPGNGISTPLPTQPGIVGNCDAFYRTKSGDGCGIIATKYGIFESQFIAWNPTVGQTCIGLWSDALWSDAYVCVSIVGHMLALSTTTAPAATATTIDGTSYPFPAFQTQIP